MDINDLEKKYGNLGKSSGKYDISDAKNKLEDLINDEDLKEALRKMKKNQKKKAMLPWCYSKYKSIRYSRGKHDIKDFIDPEVGLNYPEELRRLDLECVYIGLLLNNPAAISMYYYVLSICLFADPRMMNIYKGVLFTEGEAYAPSQAKEGFNFAVDSGDVYTLKNKLKKCVAQKIMILRRYIQN